LELALEACELREWQEKAIEGMKSFDQRFRGEAMDVFVLTGTGNPYRRIKVALLPLSLPKSLKKVYITTRTSQLITVTRKALDLQRRLRMRHYLIVAVSKGRHYHLSRRSIGRDLTFFQASQEIGKVEGGGSKLVTSPEVMR
jgi:hypothetical protein